MNNPYAAPSADLSQLQDDGQTYQPKMFALKGRIGRLRYLAYGLAVSLSIIVVMSILTGILTLISPLLAMFVFVLYIPLLGVSIVMAIRRLNDMDQNGWLSVLIIIPLVNFFFGLWLLFGRGTQGANSYGPAPCPNSRAVVITAWALLIVSVVGGIGAAIAIPAYQSYVMRATEKQVLEAPAVPAQ